MGAKLGHAGGHDLASAAYQCGRADQRPRASGGIAGHQSPGLTMNRVNAFIGSPVERIEDQRFLRGEGQFIGDLDYAGQWYAGVVRSSVAYGQIRKIEISDALKIPGVKAVMTAKDIGRPIPRIPFRRPNPIFAPYAQPVVADDVVRYVGEPLALVLAESSEIAEDAISAVAADIEHLDVV